MLEPATDAALIILLSLDARPASVVAALKELGFAVEVLQLGDRTGLYASDPRGELPAESIGRIPGVERVMSLSPRAPLALATKSREGGGIAVGDTYLFKYPSDNDPAILLRVAEDEVVAFSQKCTHLGCVVYFEAEEDRWHCPCHEGNFEPRTGEVISGPPPRALGRIDVEIRDDTIWALGYQP